MAEPIGYATLQIVPSLRGVSEAISSGMGNMAAVGRRAGTQLGQGMASGVDGATAAVDKAAAAVAKAREKEIDAAGKVRVAEAQLQALRDRGITDVGRIAAAEERVQSARRRANGATDSARTAARGLESAQENLTRAQREGADAVGELDHGLDGFADSAKSGIGSMKDMAVAAAGIGSAMELATSALDFESVTAKMNAQLGATGSLAEQYGRDVGQLYKSGVGESMQDVADAVAAAQTAFPTAGSEGEAALTKIAERASNLARIFDLDVTEATQTASQMITNGLAVDSTEAMDMLTAAMQRVPAAMRGELPELLGEYGKHFQTFGLTGKDALSLIVDMAPQGTIALDKTGDAIKELSIRATDGSKATTAAFTAIGVDGDKMATAIAQGGPKAGAAMREIASGLLSVKDPASQAQQAIALFGTPVEDLGVDKIPAFLQALSGGSGSMNDFKGAADQAGQTLNDTAQSKLGTFGRQVQTQVIETLGTAAGFLTDHKALLYGLAGAIGAAVIAYTTLRAAAAVSAIAQGAHAAATGADTAALAANKLAMGAHAVASGVIRAATAAWTAVQWLLNAALLANPITWIVVGIVALIAVIVLIATKTTWFQTAWSAVWNVVKSVFTSAWNGIKAAFSAVWNFIKSNWQTIVMVITGPIGIAVGLVIKNWDRIKGAVAAVWEFVKNATMAVINFVIAYWTGIINFFINLGQKIGATISELWENIKTGAGIVVQWITDKWNSFVDFITGLPGRIKSTLSGLWDGLKDGFRSAINFIIDGWNSFRLHFDFKIPVINKTVSFSIDTPDLPRLATGGVAGVTGTGTVFGPGTGTSDSILGVDPGTGMPSTWISAGEGVVTKKSMDAGGNRVVAALNAGWVPSARFLSGMNGLQALATGGEVGGTLEPWDGEGGLKPISVMVRRLIHKFWPEIGEIGGYRASDPYPDHPSGQALDIMISDVGLGDSVKKWLMDNKSVFDLNYTIWQQKYEQADGTGNVMEDRGSPTQNHMDHIHALFGQIGSPPNVDPNVIPGGLIYPAGKEPAPPPPDNSAVGSTPDATPAAPADNPGTGTPGSTEQPKRMKSFKELGSEAGGILAEGLAEMLGLPTWITDPGNAIKTDNGDNVRTTDQAGTGTKTPTPQTVPETPGATPTPSAPAAPEPPKAEKQLDAKDYAGWIAKAAKDLKLPEKAANIGVATGLVESGDPMQMWANNAVPESLQYPHDAVGSDYDSVGLFQQRDNGAWGTVADRMDPYRSAKMFYEAMIQVDGWESMPEGDVAQATQRSAFPDRYALKLPKAQELVKNTGLYDSGGWLHPGGVAVNHLNRPEPVLHPSHWDSVVDQTDAVRELVGSGVRGSGGQNITIYGQTTREIVGELRREQWRGSGGYGSRRR